jgi:hypothetical protein
MYSNDRTIDARNIDMQLTMSGLWLPTYILRGQIPRGRGALLLVNTDDVSGLLVADIVVTAKDRLTAALRYTQQPPSASCTTTVSVDLRRAP